MFFVYKTPRSNFTIEVNKNGGRQAPAVDISIGYMKLMHGLLCDFILATLITLLLL